MLHRGPRPTKLRVINGKSRSSQRGYMLITLMLGFALIAIGLLAVLPEIGQQIRRDREEEMRHRGTAYMRAIQHFYKKNGRYPSRLEELENTNNIRYLRKRYKDPINRDPETGKEREFKLLHMTDVNLNNGPVMAQMAGLAGQAGMQGQGGLNGAQGRQGALGAIQGALGGLAGQMGGLQQQTGLNGSNTNLNPSANPDSDSNPDSSGSSSSNGNSGSSGSGSGFNGPTFGGGPILGVASTSKEKSIRVFFEKNHYKDWLFVYMPMADRGGLLTGPVNPGMPMGNLNGGSLPGVSGISGQGQGPAQSSGVPGGQSPGFGSQNQQNSSQPPQQ
jgi:type II secretory pathway pseudopilin PulG